MFSIKSPVPALGFSWSATGSNERRYTLIAKLTFGLDSPTAELADEQQPIHVRDVLHEGGESVRYPSDVAPFKLRTDVIVVGSANGEPGPHDPFVARIIVGEVDKAVEILPRRTRSAQGVLTTGPLERTVPLRYELSYGGSGTANPAGLDLTPAAGIGGATELPRIVQPGASGDQAAVAGLGAYGHAWPDRAGGHGGGWFEVVPEGAVLTHEVDPASFNAAPRDQQTGEISFDARIVLENLVRGTKRFVTNLSWTRPIALIEHAGEQNIVALAPDTLVIDTDARLMTLTCRAQLALPGQNADGRILIDLEHSPDATMPLLAEGFRDEPSAGDASNALPFVVQNLQHLHSLDGESTIPGAAADSSGLPVWMKALKQQEAQRKPRTMRDDGRGQTATIDLDGDRDTGIPPPVRAGNTRPAASVAVVPPRHGTSSTTPSSTTPSSTAPASTRAFGGSAVPPSVRPAPPPLPQRLQPPPPPVHVNRPAAATVAMPAPTPLATTSVAYPPPPPAIPAPPPSSPVNAYPPPAAFVPARPPLVTAPAPLPTVSAASSTLGTASASSPVGLATAGGASAPAVSFGVAPVAAPVAAARPQLPSYLLGESAPQNGALGNGAIAPEPANAARGERPHSILDASNHALRGRPEPLAAEATPEPAKKADAGRAVAPEPANDAGHSLALGPNDALELIWWDPSCLPRVRKKPAFRRLIEALEDRPPDPDLDDPSLADHAQELEDKRDVFEILARGEAIDSDAIDKALDDAVRADRKVVAPLVLTGGSLVMPFDEMETLRAYVAATTPIAAGDEKLLAELAAAKDLLSASAGSCAPQLTEAMTQRIRGAFQMVKRPMTIETLRSHTDSMLLQRRHYQTRDVFQMQRLRSLLEPHPNATPIPVYFPQPLASSLPLFQRFRVRLLCDVHFKVDQQEQYAVCLKAVALARVVERRRPHGQA